MFTFCFTTVAAAALRRNRETSKATRKTTLALRTVRLGLVAAAMLAMAGMAQAGGLSLHSMGSSMGSFSNMASHSSGGGMFSQSNASNSIKFNQSGGDKFGSNKPIGMNNSNGISTTAKNTTKLDDGVKLQAANQGLGSLKQNGNKLSGLNSGKLNTNKFAGMNSDKLKNFSSMKGDKNSCDPCHCHCCSWWYCWNYPCWCPLYSCSCGCYDDVPVVECDQGYDLQLLAVRTLDSGDPDQQLGPAFRVWFRNNSEVAINHPFNVLILAARDAQPTADLPQAGVRVNSIDAGQTLAVDIRLPVDANQPGFPMLHVLVDSHREIAEVNEDNNGLVINRADILPVDMAQASNGGTTPDGAATTQTATDTPAGAPAAPPTTNGTAAPSGTPTATGTTDTAATGGTTSPANVAGNSTIPAAMQGVVAN
ncbi:MAG TPA: hypothetical protein VMJ32_02870 [Pirellulales bacterium]|nr:hypothetical protein [Pirellulales bacterium]